MGFRVASPFVAMGWICAPRHRVGRAAGGKRGGNRRKSKRRIGLIFSIRSWGIFVVSRFLVITCIFSTGVWPGGAASAPLALPIPRRTDCQSVPQDCQKRNRPGAGERSPHDGPILIPSAYCSQLFRYRVTSVILYTKAGVNCQEENGRFHSGQHAANARAW